MNSEAAASTGTGTYVLFVSSKWTLGDPSRGLAQIEKVYRDSLDKSGVARSFTFYFDEYFHNYKHPGDNALIALCQADRPDLIVLAGETEGELHAPQSETLNLIRREMQIPLIFFHPGLELEQQLLRTRQMEPRADLLILLGKEVSLSGLAHPEKYICLTPLEQTLDEALSTSHAVFWKTVFSAVLQLTSQYEAAGSKGTDSTPVAAAVLRGRKPRILFITLEFPTWQDARACGWAIRLGFEYGFKASGAEFTTLVSYPPYGGRKASFANYAREFLKNQKFDQVWIESVHTDLDQSILEWLTTVAPVRVGMIFESLSMSDEEIQNNPQGCERRRQLFLNQKPYFTHIVAIDEVDVRNLSQEGRLRCFWMPVNPIPEKFIRRNYTPPLRNVGLFYGSAYGARRAFLESPELNGLLVHPPTGPEHETEYPELFDKLHEKILPLLAEKKIDNSLFDAYMDILRRVRSECFRIYLEGLNQGCAVVNLPQYGYAYAGRVTEGMAAGRPLISFEIENRPLTREIFEPGEEILLYRKHSPAELAEHLRRIITEPRYGRRIAENATRKLSERYSMERVVGDILNWIQS